jgi:hypothetical protein
MIRLLTIRTSENTLTLDNIQNTAPAQKTRVRFPTFVVVGGAVAVIIFVGGCFCMSCSKRKGCMPRKKYNNK